MRIVPYCQTQGEARLACAQAGCEDCLRALLEENENLIWAVIRAQDLGRAEWSELEQEGWIGFWRAVKRYDPQRGVRFSTYAWQIIRRRIWIAVGRSTQAARWEEGEGPYADADGERLNTDWQNQQIREALEDGLADLSERQRRVLWLHYGWEGGSPQSFAEIGCAWGISRQRVHQIHNAGLLRLRVPALSIRLRSLCRRDCRRDYHWALRQNRKWLRQVRGRR